MKLINLEQAEEYKNKHGRYPLVIGEEYIYLDQFVELIEASSERDTVGVMSRLGVFMRVYVDDLFWKTRNTN